MRRVASCLLPLTFFNGDFALIPPFPPLILSSVFLIHVYDVLKSL